MMRKRLWGAATFVWAAVLMIVSVIPGEDLPSLHLWEADKLFHALFYGILTITTFFFHASGAIISLRRVLFVSVLICILYGFLIELIQWALPTRSFDLYDEIANSIGCGIAAIVILLTRKART